MNDTVHQFLQVILQGITWAFRTIEALWVWSWTQISGAFGLAWSDLPAWKTAIAIVALVTLVVLLAILLFRGIEALSRIGMALWTTAVTMFGIMVVVVVAGLFSHGVTWVVATVPDNFWERFI